MKARLLTVFLVVFTTIAPFCLGAGSYIPTEGEWDGKGGLRSSVPAPPEIAVEGNTVSLYFESALSDLAVYIMDENGIVYQTVVSSNGSSNYTYDLPWTAQPGEYRILMIHGTYGHLEGYFTIE